MSDFDVFEIHEAFAGQVLANLEAMNSDKFCQERVGVSSKAGEIPMDKVEKISEDSLDSIPSPLPSVKIQISGGKVYLRCKGKILLGVVNKLLRIKCLLTMPSNVLPSHLKQTFPLVI